MLLSLEPVHIFVLAFKNELSKLAIVGWVLITCDVHEAVDCPVLLLMWATNLSGYMEVDVVDD
jgi:hypothetical protein